MSETHAACHVTEMLQRCCGFLWILGACSWWIRTLLCVWFRLIKQCAGMHNGTQLPMLPAGSACMQRSACTARQQREVWLWRVPVCSATLDCVPPACLAGAQHSNQARLHTVGEQAGGVCCTGMPLGLDITYTHQKIFFCFCLSRVVPHYCAAGCSGYTQCNLFQGCCQLPKLWLSARGPSCCWRRGSSSTGRTSSLLHAVLQSLLLCNGCWLQQLLQWRHRSFPGVFLRPCATCSSLCLQYGVAPPHRCCNMHPCGYQLYVCSCVQTYVLPRRRRAASPRLGLLAAAALVLWSSCFTHRGVWLFAALHRKQLTSYLREKSKCMYIASETVHCSVLSAYGCTWLPCTCAVLLLWYTDAWIACQFASRQPLCCGLHKGILSFLLRGVVGMFALPRQSAGRQLVGFFYCLVCLLRTCTRAVFA